MRFWSDYNRVFYHPKSIVQLHEYELNSTLMPFERWETGDELFANLDREHDLLDRDLRPFLEECDQLQGLQIMTGTDDAWGGFASKYLERMRDELGKTSVWVWALEDGSRKTRVSERFTVIFLRILTWGIATADVTYSQHSTVDLQHFNTSLYVHTCHLCASSSSNIPVGLRPIL